MALYINYKANGPSKGNIGREETSRNTAINNSARR